MLGMDITGFTTTAPLKRRFTSKEPLEQRIEMEQHQINKRMTRESLDQLFPPDRSDRFFEALYGDISEGAYDIVLEFKACRIQPPKADRRPTSPPVRRPR